MYLVVVFTHDTTPDDDDDDYDDEFTHILMYYSVTWVLISIHTSVVLWLCVVVLQSTVHTDMFMLFVFLCNSSLEYIYVLKKVFSA